MKHYTIFIRLYTSILAYIAPYPNQGKLEYASAEAEIIYPRYKDIYA